MKHTEVIERFCELHADVWRAVCDPCRPADCFCGNGGFWASREYDSDKDYRNDGEALEFIENAVREALKNRGRR
jgi:hypothetical protein